MNVFYEEDGGFKVGHVMEDIGTSLQVESQSGKRSKIKANQVLVRFEGAATDFLPTAEQYAADMDPDFLWQVCGADEFGSEALAMEYFGHKPSAIEIAGVTLKLHTSPMYFYKRGKGRYQAAPEANLKAALASIERKKREAEQMAHWVQQLKEGQMPDEMRPHLNMLLYKPDRNTLMVKACEAAVAEMQMPLPRLFFNAGAWQGQPAHMAQHDYHFGKFLAEYFPIGTGYRGVIDIQVPETLPVATVAAFSIDDAETTEIDDAFSVTKLANGDWEVGIHIAAPALFFGPASALDKLAADRQSTVYLPGQKITMLPDLVVAAATLAEGRACPAVSLYARFEPESLALLSTRSAVEQVPIARNLRYDHLETYFHQEAVTSQVSTGEFGSELLLLHRIARKLGEQRGKAEQDRQDYQFVIDDGHVSIVPRVRGSPVDTLVAELMIFTNSQWGKWLADSGVAAIYRAQSNMKTRMTTQPLPHEGLGVAQYAWSSSPLRRYVDLINQRQLIALISGATPLFPKRSPALNEIARQFDVTYDAYAEFQRNMERYWCLRYLEQEGLQEYEGTLIRDELVRANSMPMIVKLDKNPALPPKTAVRVRVETIDYWEIGGKFTLITSG